MILALALLALVHGAAAPLGALPASAASAASASRSASEASDLYHEMRLEGVLSEAAFVAAYESVERHGIAAGTLAIADMSQPSTAERLYVLDLRSRTLVLRTFVAHGAGSGELRAERFSNRDGSHQTSLGLYRVGRPVTSPKHGRALLLDGLDRGLNDAAAAREVIIHGASYVSPAFIAQHGRLGRSWGCPAVPDAEMGRMIDLLRDGGLLFVYGG